MESITQKMESVTKELKLWKPCLTTEIIEINGWRNLIDSGKFDEEKAVMSLEATSKSFLNNLEVREISEVFENPTITLASLKKYRGEINMRIVIHHLLYQVSEFYGVVRNLTDRQIEILCDFIFKKYHYLTISDLKLCFDFGKDGRYGKVLDRLDCDIISGWLKKYAEDRAFEAARKMAHKAELRNKETAAPMPEWFEEFVNTFNDKKRVVTQDELNSDETLLKQIQKDFNDKNPDCDFQTFKRSELLKIKKFLNQTQ